jgi:exosortase D (VPLPA-CTERM-specific)
MVAESPSLLFHAVHRSDARPPSSPQPTVYQYSPHALSLIGTVVALLGIPFAASLASLWSFWTQLPEYSHGPLLPLIAVFLVWQQKDILQRLEFRGSWWGPLAVAVAGAMFIVGGLGATAQLQQYGLVVALLGVTLSLTGGRAFSLMVVPLLILVLMIPLPMFMLNNLSAELQLISSALGVAFIRAAGITVFREGNIIDLAGYELQVVEACGGLRYLFPLMVLAFLIAFFYKGALWKRVVIVVASVPITVAMNSLRIGTIGVLVKHWGAGMADGFLHKFQGWMVFMLSTMLLLGLGAVLNRVGPEAKDWRQLFGLEFPLPTPADARCVTRSLPTPFLASAALIVAIAVIGLVLPTRTEVSAPRQAFVSFPALLGDWTGRRQSLEASIVDALQLSDYILADYVRADGRTVNFYASYYDSQRDRAVVHSPRACIPGGGWHIEEQSRVALADTGLRVNRLVIANGALRQLVYYWFDQRGRNLTSEYLVKSYLLWDAVTRHRTDGAMVRLITPMDENDDPDAADARLADFGKRLAALLPAYVPR